MSNAYPSSETPRRRATDRVASGSVMSPSVALVVLEHATFGADPMIDAVPLRVVRQDPSFVTHLIAIAERYPQTRVLRRASPQDAMAAYRAVDANDHPTPIGGRTRQDI